MLIHSHWVGVGDLRLARSSAFRVRKRDALLIALRHIFCKLSVALFLRGIRIEREVLVPGRDDAAVLVASSDPDAWAEAIEGVLSDEEQQANLTKQGREQAGSYRWADTARKTWTVYRSVS